VHCHAAEQSVATWPSKCCSYLCLSWPANYVPISAACRSLGAWRQQDAAAINAEHKQIWELAQREVARGAAGGNIWHTASHAEHARPMLHASGSSIQQALFHAFHSAPDAPSAEAVLGYVVMLVNLAGGLARLLPLACAPC
jgi:hypothetical protein